MQSSNPKLLRGELLFDIASTSFGSIKLALAEEKPGRTSTTLRVQHNAVYQRYHMSIDKNTAPKIEWSSLCPSFPPAKKDAP